MFSIVPLQLMICGAMKRGRPHLKLPQNNPDTDVLPRTMWTNSRTNHVADLKKWKKNSAYDKESVLIDMSSRLSMFQSLKQMFFS